VFDLFDFWDGRDGLVDGFKLGDFLRCCGLNPTCALVIENGGTKKLGITASSSSSSHPFIEQLTEHNYQPFLCLACRVFPAEEINNNPQSAG